MLAEADAQERIADEAIALLTRLARVRPFALTMPMLAAAAPSAAAFSAIDTYLVREKAQLERKARRFVRWIRSPAGSRVPPSAAQRRLVLMKLMFNRILTQLDLFADALTQRSEHETGVWLSGLDAVAEDSLVLSGEYYQSPPLICYLDRGHGAAIRRARTRLPGGGSNPVSVIRVPRERMIGSGIGGSLIHEVGHQAAALLDLVRSVGTELSDRATGKRKDSAWDLFFRWRSEILADAWSSAFLGVGATLGLIGVVSLPRAFVFRTGLDDPHPIPWIRVRLSCAFGRALFPDSQWDELDGQWRQLYPIDREPSDRRALLEAISQNIPEFVDRILNHRPTSLGGSSLADVLPISSRQPDRLRAHATMETGLTARLVDERPSFAMAVLGQAKFDRRIDPVSESRLINRLLIAWATKRSSGVCPPIRMRKPNGRVHMQEQHLMEV